ncbi:MAG: DUF1905 domain-containing protein [Sphingobacteriales bacterium]|nr:MAG: DUF1905 domain-containing protein [Sphingobacteriales bacterium]
MPSFSATIFIIGINPYVLLPQDVLQAIFTSAGKDKSPIAVKGKIDGNDFTQTLVKYAGKWRLYLNTEMLNTCGKHVSDSVKIIIQFDKKERLTPMHPALVKALKHNKTAEKLFNELAPYLQKEIKRYINGLKTEAAVDKNVQKAISFLQGKERFIGRDKP